MVSKHTCIAVLLFTTAAILSASEPKDSATRKTFAVPRHGGLELAVPAGWKDTVRPSPQGGMPTIEFSSKTGKFQVLITPIPSPGGDPDFNSPAKVRAIAEAEGNQMLSTAREKALTLSELKGEKAVGYYLTLTDKAPAPGSFEYATFAFVGVGDFILSVTILHHEKETPDVRSAIDMLKGATQKAPVVPAELRIAGPSGGWELVLPIKGLELTDEKANKARKMKQIAAEQPGGLIVSVFIEPSQKEGDSSTVRDVYWGRGKNSPIKKDNIKLAKAGEYATVDYLVPDIGGAPIRQKNVNIYIVHDGMWIDVHLSKIGFTDAEQPLFDAAIKAIRFEKTAPPKTK